MKKANKTTIKNVAYDYNIECFLSQLDKGAFLTTQYLKFRISATEAHTDSDEN